MRQIYMLLSLLIIFPMLNLQQARSQEKKENPFDMTFGGFVRYEAYYDTYKSIDTRDGNLLLYPKRPEYDPNGLDINKTGQLEMASIQTRAKVLVTGPNALGAKVSGYIETDFEGTSQNVVRTLRLRHAFLKMEWGSTRLMLGQYWHPLFVAENFPEVLAFGAALPIQPFSRAPQARINHKAGNFDFMLAAIIHGYNRTPGEYEAQRNAGIPDMQLQLKYKTDNVIAGATAGYKVLKPRLQTGLGYKTDETVGSYNSQAFLKIITRSLIVKGQIVYGENLSSYTMLGAYGVETGSRDIFDNYTYTNMNTVAGWIEIMSDYNTINYGFFAGYTANLGFSDALEYTDTYQITAGRAADMASLIRISPRLTYDAGPLMLGVEYMYNLAEYGTDFDTYYKAVATESSENSRFLFSATYTF